MAHMGTNADNPAMAREIDSLFNNLLDKTQAYEPDVAVNAAARLAAALLSASNVTRQQADRLMKGLFDALNSEFTQEH